MTVVIAGGGPNGLMLACELSLSGVRPVVLERLPERNQVQKANGMVGQVVRLVDHRGLHERLGGGPVPFAVPQFMFAAMSLDLAALDVNPLTILQVPQRELERVLEERAIELGVQIRRGHEVTGFAQSDAGVMIEVSGPDGAYELSADYLVGADGGGSTVRKLAGIGFAGVTTDDSVARTAHVSLPDSAIVDGHLDVPGLGPIAPFVYTRTEHGLFIWVMLEPGKPMVTSIEWNPGLGDDVPVTIEEVHESVARVLGADVPMAAPDYEGPHLLRRLSGGNTRLADAYRAGRVFLVGDAAHVHSAIGGPGLNLGMQDAANLGWKLAAQINGWAPDGLLDTYELERRPVAERVVVQTKAQSALIGPGSEVTALRELFGELLRNKDNVKHIAETMAGADIRYAMASEHVLVGKFLPEVDLSDGRRTAELTRTGRPVLLDFAGIAEDVVRGWSDRVDRIAVQVSKPPAGVVLVRPDGYVAWAGDDVQDGLVDALATWFGTSRIAVAA